MAGEQWACKIVEMELKRTVVIHDDGSAPGMYDLRIGPMDAPEVAIECVGAVDRIFTETWNIGPAKGPLEYSIKGDWIVTIASTASVKGIKQRIEPLLQELENRNIDEVWTDHRLRRQDSILFAKFNTLHITHALCYRSQGTGKVHLGMPGIGGAVDEHGSAIPEWIGTFLRDSKRQDVLSKLQRSGAPNRQAFVIVGFGGAPWPVESYLAGLLEQTPSQAPNLPLPLTGVWLASGASQKGLRWDGTTWQVFDTQSESIDD
jgi:hypothetical protein